MMRRSGFLAVVLVLVLSSTAIAQTAVSVRGNVGAAFFRSPTGLNSVLNSGVDLGLSAGVELVEDLELEAYGSYDQFTFNEDNIALSDPRRDYDEVASLEGGNYNLLSVGLGLRYIFSNESDAHPYVTGGIGYYRTSISNSESLREGETTSGGIHLGAGAEFRIDETYSIFFEPRYVIVYTGGEDLGVHTSSRFVPIRLGLEMQL